MDINADGSNAIFNVFRQEIWSELEQHLRADDQRWDGEQIRVRHGSFEVTLDQHADVSGRSSIVHTRLRAAFVNRDGFRFRVRREDWLSDIAKLFGAEDLLIGDEDFDDAFVVSANDEARARKLLSDPELRRRMVASEADLIEVRDDDGWFGPEFPPEVDELFLCTRNQVSDANRIANLYVIFADLLNLLCHLGAAYDEDPHVEL